MPHTISIRYRKREQWHIPNVTFRILVTNQQDIFPSDFHFSDFRTLAFERAEQESGVHGEPRTVHGRTFPCVFLTSSTGRGQRVSRTPSSGCILVAAHIRQPATDRQTDRQAGKQAGRDKLLAAEKVAWNNKKSGARKENERNAEARTTDIRRKSKGVSSWRPEQGWANSLPEPKGQVSWAKTQSKENVNCIDPLDRESSLKSNNNPCRQPLEQLQMRKANALYSCWRISRISLRVNLFGRVSLSEISPGTFPADCPHFLLKTFADILRDAERPSWDFSKRIATVGVIARAVMRPARNALREHA